MGHTDLGLSSDLFRGFRDSEKEEIVVRRSQLDAEHLDAEHLDAEHLDSEHLDAEHRSFNGSIFSTDS